MSLPLSLTDQIRALTAPPKPSPAPPSVPPRTVILYDGLSWSSPKLELRIDDYVANRRQRLPNFMIDKADWVAWNLPLGTVMTLADHVPENVTGADLSGAGATLDLVGSSSTRSADLGQVGLTNAVASFWWREVDLWQGAFELFADKDFTGVRTAVFLCEWPRDTAVNITSWWMNDQPSSIRWRSLNDRQTVTLYADPNGTGTRYDNIKGWGSFKELTPLWDYGFNDVLSSFSWSSVSPKKEIIDPIMIPNSGGTGSTQLTSMNTGDNRTELAQSLVVTLRVEKAQTLTVETSDTNHFGMSVRVSQTMRAGAEGIATSETTVEFGFTYDFTTTKTVTNSTTSTIDVSLSQTFNAPKQTHYEASLIADIASIPPTDFTTKATRWYDFAIPGGTRDSSNNNWYKREETVTFRIGGGIMSRSKLNMVARDL